MKFSSIAIAALFGHVSAADVFKMENLNLASIDILEKEAYARKLDLENMEGADQEKIDQCTTKYDPETTYDDDEKVALYQSLIDCYKKVNGGDEKPYEETEDEQKEREEYEKKAEEEKKAAEQDTKIEDAKKRKQELAKKLTGFKKDGKCMKSKPADDATKKAQIEGWNKVNDCLAKRVASIETKLQALKDKVAKFSEGVKDAEKKTKALKPLEGADDKTLKKQIFANRRAIKNLTPLQEKKEDEESKKDGDDKKTK